MGWSAAFARDVPAELELELAIRDRGVTRILGCRVELDFGDGTADFTHLFTDGGPRKVAVRHVYPKPGIYTVKAKGGKPATTRERACEGERTLQVIVVGEAEPGTAESAREAANASLCPQGWSVIPGSVSGPRFKCRPDKPLSKIECQNGSKFFEQDGVIGCQ